MAVVVHLPRFNGTLAAGVAGLADQGLPEIERLRVPTGLSRDRHVLGVYSAAATMGAMGRTTDSLENRFLASAAYLAVSTGMVYSMKRGASNEISRGSDWIDTDQLSPTQAQVNYVEGLLDEANFSSIMTVCLATKYSWWTTNHHVGQGGWSPYVLKVARVLGEEYTTDQMKAAIHRAGHWMGTHQGLRYFGIYLPVLMRYVVEDPIAPVIADDFVLRQTSCPAGTARVCVVEAAYRLTRSSPLWFLCPNFDVVRDNVRWVTEMNQEVADYRALVSTEGHSAPLLPMPMHGANNAAMAWIRAHYDPRAPYHIGADYLLGAPGSRVQLNIPDGLGLVGPVMCFLHPRSTITKSPHISKAGAGGLTPVYESSATYDEMWNSSVMAFATSQAQINSEDLTALYGAHRGGAVDPHAFIELQLAMGGTYEDAVADYRRHEASLRTARAARNEPIPPAANIPPPAAFGINDGNGGQDPDLPEGGGGNDNQPE